MILTVLKEIRDWSEVWGLFIPIVVLLRHGHRHPHYVKPIVVYVWVALFLNLLIDVIWKFKAELNFPHWLQTNNYLYNTHSVVRFFLFSLFFIRLDQPWKTVK